MSLLTALLVVVGRPLRSDAVMVFTPSGFVEDVVASGLPYATGIAFAPDGRMFIALKGGVVRVWENGALRATPFVDITSQVSNSHDRGLLGIAVHPNFPATPYVYLLFTWNPPGYSSTADGGRVNRLVRVEADPAQNYNVALSGSGVPQTTPGGPGHVIMVGTNSTFANIGNPIDGRDTTKASCMTGLTMAGAPVEDCIPTDENSHSIGTVMFGVDGSLFLGAGDASNYTAVDPRALRAINLNSLAGKILRIDPLTGLGLPDNPFFDATCPQCNRSKVYSMGLRNPFRFTVHPATNEPYIGDVGWNTWEEINSGKGANFGWPCYEGGVAGSSPPVESGITTSLSQGSYAANAGTSAACAALYAQGLGAARAPIFAYNHNGTDGAGQSGGASANAGAFYAGDVYPPQHQNALFIVDYNRLWIRYLTFDALGVATVNNFARETANGIVQVLAGPDTNLYAVVYAGTGSQVRRIRYVAGGNTPPTAVASATPTIGSEPLTVTFSSQGTFDPDAQGLAYAWTFGDGATSTAKNPTHLYDTSGVYTATLTVTELTAPFASRSADVVITVGNNPPLATITAPANGTTYRIGDAIPYAGSATVGGVPVDPSQLSWELRLHHNQHIHFDFLPGGAGGVFNVVEHGDSTFYELCLTVTEPPALTDTQCVTLLPELVPITLATDPAGLLINYEDEGITQASPLIVSSVVGSQQITSVQAIQGGRTFSGWSDGVLSTSHPFVVGTTPATYTAQYVNRPPVAVVTATPVSGVAPLSVAFTGSGSSDPESATLTYAWDFGDGSGSTAADPVHVYTLGGTYQAALTVTDQLNGTAAQAVTVVVTGAGQCGNGTIEADEACDGGACCTAGCQFASAGTVCRAAAGACDVAETCSGSSAACPANVLASDGTSCSDGNPCDGAETCQSGACTAGTPLVCDDSNVCTTDSCAPATGCVFTNNTAPCSDGIACTSDVCSNGACTGTPACPAGQTCNLTTGACDGTPTPYTLWPSTTVPGMVDAGADSGVELGVKFRADVAGYVTGVRFYKSAANTGTHVGNLWSSGGTNLATAFFTGETASGWQQVTFSQPVAIAADTDYVVSYYCPNGHYSFGGGYFATTAVDSPPLRAPTSAAVGGNGVFAYGSGSGFPNRTYNAANYWVDVVFTQTAATVTSLAVSPPSPTVAVGATQAFVATASYSDGHTQDVTGQATWASTNPAVATVGTNGLATAVNAGTATISATFGGRSGAATLSASEGAVSIATATLPGAAIGKPYTATLAASGGTPPYSWEIATGALPAGLTLDASTGVIAGTPTTSGVASFTVRVSAGPESATQALGIGVGENAVVAENLLPGSPSSQWDVSGAGDDSIQGFATDMSVNRGETVAFKIKTPATNYRVDIYRLGYYGGLGARFIQRVGPSVQLPQVQPACLSQGSTGLTDCGNWGVSASWNVPASAVSGVYIAKLVREDPEDGRASHIPFVVRDDTGGSSVLFQTSDTTWQAYNTYGGNSLYTGAPAGRAYKVSYNRPFTSRCCVYPGGSLLSYLFNAEYAMVRWLERNGYDLSYTTGLDSDRRGAELLEHDVFLSVGHDEYWSGPQRAAVEAARDAGVHLAFFTGNQMFWKTRWEPSIDGSGTSHRTLVCYKETHANAKIDPLPGIWTGTWRDPRFGPHDGGRPENGVTGSIFTVNGVRNDALQVPAADGKMRFWRNTSIASLPAGQVATFPAGTLGFEWNEDLDNGARPAGVIQLSTTTVSGVPLLQDYGSTYSAGTATHHLTLHRHASGALVFSAGLNHWSWGLDAVHDQGGVAADARIQQATVNLLADMGVQPATLQAGVVAATASTDVTAPSASITSPVTGASVSAGTPVTISGTASDVGGLVGGIEVSTDGGTTWHPASGRSTWTYAWTPSGLGSAALRVRATDDSGNLGAASAAVTVTVAAAPFRVTTTALPAGTPGVPYTATLAASGGTPPYTWAVASGALPAGLTLTPSTGVIAGTPTASEVASFTVEVSAGAETATQALGITIATGSLTLWPSTTVPALVDAGGDSGVELGVKFRSDVAGYVTGVRFYKSAANTGTHVGTLWSSAGTPLATATFTGETASGWQQVTFPSPVAIAANTTYVVSYHCPNGHYSFGGGYFATAGVDNPPLHAPASAAVGGNGVFAYSSSSAFPNQSYNAANYWVDVTFTQTTATLTSIAVSPANPTVTVGATQAFTAGGTYSDGSTQDVTGQVTWASTSPAVATVSAAGLATAVSAGTTTISAALGAVNGTTTLTAATAPLRITTTALPAGALGVAYTAPLAASGGTPPYTWAVASGGLPAGVTLNAGTGVISGTPTASGVASFTVEVSAGAETATQALSITIATGASTLWSSTTVPALVDAGGDNGVELGVKFRSDVAGYVTGVRFYKSAANTGTHVGTLWSSAGTPLATATFTGETASGWQQVTFASPVAIAANTTYVVSYHCPNGHYSFGGGYFATAGVDNPPLHAPASAAVGGNGVFAYGPSSSYPSNTYNAANYWVDVVFSTTAP